MLTRFKLNILSRLENLLVNRYFLFFLTLVGLALALTPFTNSSLVVKILLILAWLIAVIGIYRSQSLSNHKDTRLLIILSIAVIVAVLLLALYAYIIKPYLFTYYYLKPASEIEPSMGCSDNEVPELVVILGMNEIVFSEPRKMYRILTYDYEDILSFKKSSEGLLISGKLFDPDGNELCEIDGNKFLVNRNENFIIDRPNRNELYVKNRNNRIFLGVKFLNRNTVIISGIFSLKDYPTVEINEEGISNVENQASIAGFCIVNSGILISCKNKDQNADEFGLAFPICD